MAKKKLDVRSKLHVDHSLTGRKPAHPKRVDGRLEQLAKETDTWLRLFREVWFNLEEPLIELAVGATELPDLSTSYDAAIETMRWVEASAAYAQVILEKGKATATRKRADMAKKSAGARSQSSRKALRQATAKKAI